MRRSGQRGQSLVEVVVAIAIVAAVLAATGAGVVAALHRAGADPQQTALERAAEQEARIAVDIVKYQGGAIAPNAVATSVPLENGATMPAHLSVATAALPGGGVSITLTATSDTDASKTASVTQSISAPAPVPSATVPAPNAAPAPTGAP